jgi:protein-disulfide isomerase
VRDYPLSSVHQDSFNAALAANAARDQGKFFEYIEILYRNQDQLSVDLLKKYAVDLGLDLKKFELVFNSETTAAEVRKDLADGGKLHINSTPTIFVNGVRLRQISPDGMRKAIDRALKK